MSQFPAKPEQSTSAEAALLTALNNLATTPVGFAIVKNSNNTFSNVSLTGVANVPVSGGGTGVASFTAYAVITGGTTSTGPLQQVSGTGNSGQVLTSNGAGILPTWQALPSAGAGTVTTVSVATANGFSGTVANATTTPSITIIAGAIVPTSVNGLTITTTTGTLTVTGSKVLTISNTLTLAGTDSTTMTFPGTSATIARTDAANTFTGHQTIEGVTSTGATGTGKFVFDTSPTLTTAILGSSTATTQTQLDNSTKVSTTAYVDLAVSNAVAGVNPAMAVQCATTAAGDTSGLTYLHVAGIGDTFTGTANTAITIDGHTLLAGDRVLIKNDTQTSPGSVSAGVFNGVYLVTTIQSLGVPPVLTRALDYDTPSDINNTGAIPVVLGTANANTSWILTSSISAVGTGTNVLTYAQFSIAPTTIVVGPASATDGVPALFNGTTGKLIKNSTPTGTGNPVMANSPTLVTPALGAATATSINSLTITTSTGTITITNAKTLTMSDSTTLATNAITLGGGEVITFSASNALSLLTSGTTSMTFPAVTDTVAVLGTAQTFTATNTHKQIVYTNNAITASGNAATVPITSRLNTVTNNSAATLTITMTTTSAVDGQLSIVRILDSSAAAQTITWINTENSTVTAPTTSNGSTTLFLTVGFIYNSGTSKWRCIASA